MFLVCEISHRVQTSSWFCENNVLLLLFQILLELLENPFGKEWSHVTIWMDGFFF